MNKSNILLIIVGGLLAGGLIYAILFFSENDISQEIITQENFQENIPIATSTVISIISTNVLPDNLLFKGEIQGIPYEVIRTGRIDDPVAKIITIDVAIEQLQLDEGQVEIVAQKIIDDLTQKDPDVDKIYLFFFSDKNLIENQSYDIAQAIWQPSEGNITYEIAEQNIRNNYKLYIIMKSAEDRMIR